MSHRTFSAAKKKDVANRLQNHGLKNFISNHSGYLYGHTVSASKVASFCKLGSTAISKIMAPPDLESQSIILYGYIESGMENLCELFIEALESSNNGQIIEFIDQELSKADNLPSSSSADSGSILGNGNTSTKAAEDNTSDGTLAGKRRKDEEASTANTNSVVFNIRKVNVDNSSSTATTKMPKSTTNNNNFQGATFNQCNAIVDSEVSGSVTQTTTQIQGESSAPRLNPDVSEPDAGPVGGKILWEIKGNTDTNAHALGLVLNVYKYPNGVRVGSEVDVDNIVKVLEKFNVRIFVAKTQDRRVLHADIDEVIERYKKELIKGKTKVSFVFIMGNGKGNGLLCDSNEETRCLEKYVFNSFNNQKCEQMKGQPKLFFANLCRGSDLTPPVPDGPLKTVDAPTVADMLVCWSTTAGNFSIRDPKTGSKFIIELCSRFNKYEEYLRTKSDAKPHDVEVILKSVQKIMRGQETVTTEGTLTQTMVISNRTFETFKLNLNSCTYGTDDELPF